MWPARAGKGALQTHPLCQFYFVEPDNVVGAAMAQRMVVVARRMRGTLQGCEGEGLEPSGARLGVACKEHVGGSWLEAGMDARDACLQCYLRQPKAGIPAKRERWPPDLEGQRRDDRGNVGVRSRQWCIGDAPSCALFSDCLEAIVLLVNLKREVTSGACPV